jgi:hypothetical protein
VLISAPDGPLDLSRLDRLASSEQVTDRFVAIDGP